MAFLKHFALTLLICLFLSIPQAQAFESPATPEQQKTILRMGQEFQAIAEAFGCPELAWGNITNNGFIMLLEYVPEGVEVDNWTRMVTVNVFALSSDADTDLQLIQGLQDTRLSTLMQNDTVIQHEFFNKGTLDQTLFIEYTIGNGDIKEHNAGAMLRVSDNMAAMIQIQSRRDSKITEEDIALIRQIAAP